MKVLIYDGECGMCSRIVRFIVRINRNPDLYVTDFESDWSRLSDVVRDDIDSVIFIDDGSAFYKSTAALKVLASAHGLFRIALIGLIAPKFIRDGIYDLIARNRKRIFGGAFCIMPDANFQRMYLD